MMSAPINGDVVAQAPIQEAPTSPKGARSRRRLKHSEGTYRSLFEAWRTAFECGNFERRLDLLKVPSLWKDEPLLMLTRTLVSIEGNLTRLRQQLGEPVPAALSAPASPVRSHKRKPRPEYSESTHRQISDSRSCIDLDRCRMGTMLELLSEPQAWTPGYLMLVRESLRVLEGRVARMRSQVEGARKRERGAEEAARRALELFPERFDPDELLDEARMLYPDFP
jgi:hypothetical protein